MIRIIIRIEIYQIVEVGECHSEVELSTDRIIEEGHSMLTIIEMIIGEEIFRGMQKYRGQNFKGGYRGNCRNDNFGRGRSSSRERQYSGNFRQNDRSSSNRSRSGLRASTNGDRIRCFKCRENDLFNKDCLNSQTEKEPEQMQQMCVRWRSESNKDFNGRHLW